MQEIAINNNAKAIEYIENPSEKIKKTDAAEKPVAQPAVNDTQGKNLRPRKNRPVQAAPQENKPAQATASAPEETGSANQEKPADNQQDKNNQRHGAQNRHISL